MRSKIITVMLLASCAVFLSACETVDYRQNINTCSANAYQLFPPSIGQTTVTSSRIKKVPTGKTTCVWQAVGNTVEQKCTEEMRDEREYFDEVVSIDMNAAPRDQLTRTCAADLCLRKYNNPQCKLEANKRNVAPMHRDEAYKVIERYFGADWSRAPFGFYGSDALAKLCGQNGQDPLPFHEVEQVDVFQKEIWFRKFNWMKAWGPCGMLSYGISGDFSQADVDQILAAMKSLGAKL